MPLAYKKHVRQEKQEPPYEEVPGCQLIADSYSAIFLSSPWN